MNGNAGATTTAAAAPLLERPKQRRSCSRRSTALVSLLCACGVLALVNQVSFERPAGPQGQDEQGNRMLQQKSNGAVKKLQVISVMAAVAAATTIPRMLRQRKLAGKRKPMSRSPMSTKASLSPNTELQKNIGKLCWVKFPNTKDVILCRLLKLQQISMGQFATLSIENGKVGTKVATNVVKDVAMKMASSELLQAIIAERKKQGKEGITRQELQYIQLRAQMAALSAVGNGTLEGVAHMVGPNASVITVQADVLQFPKNEKELVFLDACNKGDFETVKSMTDEGMSPDIEDPSGRTALYYAAREGREKIVKAFIEMGGKVDKEANSSATPMFVAAQSGNTAVMKMLLDAGADVKKPRNITYPFITCQNGHIDALNLFLEAGADAVAPSMAGFTCLYIASQNGHVKIVERLLQIPEIKKNINEGMEARAGATAALIAAQMGHFDVLKLLSESGADINKPMSDGTAPLKVAAAQGDPELLEFLIEKGADVNAANKDGFTALMAAAVRGNVRAADLLIRKGADLKKQTTTKQPVDALTIARQEGKKEVAQILEKAIEKQKGTA